MESPLTVDVQELAWAAGLFEGEGSMGLNRGYVNMQLAMTDEDIVRRFAKIAGCGNVHGPYTRILHHRPIWQWATRSARDTERLLLAFMPFLGIRRTTRAVEVLARAATIKSHSGPCRKTGGCCP